MNRRQDNEELMYGLRQLGRYGIVGMLNATIDFTLTNALVIYTGASGPAALFIISLTACFFATMNGYFLNRSWTFGHHDRQLQHATVLKYFSVAFMAMMVNTSIFLFVYQFLTEQMDITRLTAVNLAKVVGVGTAAIVAFLGYRISVFRPAAVESFRHTFRFEESSRGISLPRQLLILVAGAAALRLLYLSLTTAVFGEATNYGWLAQAVAQGDWAQARSGWFNLYCYWEALFYLAGLDPVHSAIGASLVPGILLVVPMAWVARCLYGEKVAWLAGWLIAFHPRLIVYSGNGFPESFYLLLLAVGLSILAVSSIKALSPLWITAAGLSLGAFFTVNNDGIILVMMVILGLVLLGRRAFNRGFLSSSPWVMAPLRSTVCVVMGFLLAVGAYSGLTELKMGNAGLFTRVSIFEREYSVQLDPQSAALETYGLEGQKADGRWAHTPLGEHLWNLVRRLPGNLLHTLRTTPGVLLTPVWFFALMLPLFSRSKDDTLLPEWPWLAVLIFPFVTYPLIYVEARFLFPAILPVNLFGAAGLVALSVFIGNKGYVSYFYPVAVSGVLAVCLAVMVWRGHQIEDGYKYNREMAVWIKEHIPAGQTIVGDGYGFVSTTGFLAQYATVNRLIHYDPKKIVDFVKQKHAEWLILYEPFILRVNPELLPVLTRGLPGMSLAYQTKDNLGRRIQVYHLNDSHSTPSPAEKF